MVELECPSCHGARLKEEVLSVYVGDKNIYEITCLSIRDLYKYLDNLELTEEQAQISELIVKEIEDRLTFLTNVGLDY